MICLATWSFCRALERELGGALFADRWAVDPTGETDASDPFAGILFAPLSVTMVGRLEYALVFRPNRERLLKDDIDTKFLKSVLRQPKVKVSTDHFSVDGTWVSMKIVRPEEDQVKTPENRFGELTAQGNSSARLKRTFTARSGRKRRLFDHRSGRQALTKGRSRSGPTTPITWRISSMRTWRISSMRCFDKGDANRGAAWWRKAV